MLKESEQIFNIVGGLLSGIFAAISASKINLIEQIFANNAYPTKPTV